MPTYIALLRGINVSGQKIIKMADLKDLLASLPLNGIRTYIQSGNVVFEAEKAVIGNRLHEDLIAHLDHEISLLEASNDAQTTGVYRKKIASTLLRRAINQAIQRAQ